MGQGIEIHRVMDGLPEDFVSLRSEARSEGFGFIERLTDEWDTGIVRFDRRDEALPIVREEGVLAGIGGLTIDPVLPEALRMRRFYVRTAFRGRGIGKTLATALLDRARLTGRIVTVNAGTMEASAFWDAVGFELRHEQGYTHIFSLA